MENKTHNELIEKAKVKKDGIYSHKGILYAVKNNKFVLYSDIYGDVYMIQGVFRTRVSKGNETFYNNRHKKLQCFLNTLK